MKSVLTDLYICSIFYRFNLKSIADVSSIDLKKEEPILSPFETDEHFYELAKDIFLKIKSGEINPMEYLNE